MPAATGTAVLDSDGTLARVVVVDGSVYEPGAEPGLLFTGGSGVDAAGTPVLDESFLKVSRIHVTVSGSGYESAPPMTVVDMAGGKGLAGTATLLSTGSVKRIIVLVQGFGYTGATVAFNNTGTGGSGAAATANLSILGGVRRVDVVTGGLYKTTPDVQFIPTGSLTGITPATATAVLNLTNGTVVEFANFVPGVYTVAPTVVFTPPSTCAAIYHLAQALWPPLPYFHTDEKTGIVVGIIKQVVQAGTLYPGRSGYRGPFIDQQTYDKWRTYQFTSKVDLSTLPSPESWPTTHPFSLPPRLLVLILVWSDIVSKLTNSQKTSANVRVSSGSSGGIAVKSSSGFHGRVAAFVTREYLIGPLLPGSLPVPFIITPSSGSVILRSTHANTSAQRGDDGGRSLADQFQNQVHSIDVRDHLIGSDVQVYSDVDGSLTSENLGQIIHKSPPQAAVATSGGGSTIGVFANGTPSRATIDLPFSTLYDPNLAIPYPRLIPGQVILWDANPEEWRFGIWVVERVYVTIPVH